MPTKIIINGHDPGTVNYALSQIQVWKPKDVLKWELLHLTMLKNTIKALNGDLMTAKMTYLDGVGTLPLKANITVAERFMTRGRTNGATGECVNVMLGILVGSLDTVELVTASTWKNTVNRKFELKCLYAATPIPPHVIDSTLIAIWRGYIELGLKPFYDVNKSWVKDFYYQIIGAWEGPFRRIVQHKDRIQTLVNSIK